jgi:hypothetical protein
MKHRNTSVIVAAIAVVAMFIPANDAHAATPPAGGVKASYNGRTLDLSKSWEDARACNVTANGTTCYATEAAMDAAVASSPPSRVAAGTCSTALRLYDGTSFTGQALNVYATQTTVALSGLGFASRTSSYRIGACSATLRAGSSVYPGTTAPNVSSGSMLAGCNQPAVCSHTTANSALLNTVSGANRCRPPVAAGLPIKKSGGDGARPPRQPCAKSNRSG